MESISIGTELHLNPSLETIPKITPIEIIQIATTRSRRNLSMVDLQMPANMNPSIRPP